MHFRVGNILVRLQVRPCSCLCQVAPKHYCAGGLQRVQLCASRAGVQGQGMHSSPGGALAQEHRRGGGGAGRLAADLAAADAAQRRWRRRRPRRPALARHERGPARRGGGPGGAGAAGLPRGLGPVAGAGGGVRVGAGLDGRQPARRAHAASPSMAPRLEARCCQRGPVCTRLCLLLRRCWRPGQYRPVQHHGLRTSCNHGSHDSDSLQY